MKVKITQAGWAGYTGMFGTVYFEDGIADIPNRLEALRIGALVSLVEVREDGSEGEVVSPSEEIIRTKRFSATVEPPRARGTETEPVAEDTVEPVVEDVAEPVVDSTPAYSREQLEAIADEKGIAGLREIATPLGVKGTSINGLITEILAHSKPA